MDARGYHLQLSVLVILYRAAHSGLRKCNFCLLVCNFSTHINGILASSAFERRTVVLHQKQFGLGFGWSKQLAFPYLKVPS